MLDGRLSVVGSFFDKSKNHKVDKSLPRGEGFREGVTWAVAG